MGMQFNVYERPITRREYDYLKLHCQEYLIGENEKMFGPVGKAEGHEWAEEDQLDYAQEPSGSGSVEGEPEQSEGQDEGDGGPEMIDGWDADDVRFVDSMDYSAKQTWLKDNGLNASGDKATLRQRMLEALRDAEVEEDEDDE